MTTPDIDVARPENPEEFLSLRPSPPPIPKELERILAFESVASLISLYESIGWTPQREIQLLFNIILHTDNDNTRLRALTTLQARRSAVLQACGLLVKATKTNKNEDGSQTTFSTNLVANALNTKPPKKHKFKRSKPNVKTETVPCSPDTTPSTGPAGGATDRPDTGDTGTGQCTNEVQAPEPVPTESLTAGASNLHRPPTGFVPGGLARDKSKS